jgi:hypothetical protein
MHREIMTHCNSVLEKIFGVQHNTRSIDALLVERTVIWLNKKHLRENVGLCQKIYSSALHCIMRTSAPIWSTVLGLISKFTRCSM